MSSEMRGSTTNSVRLLPVDTGHVGPATAVLATHGSLPRPWTSFVGRDAEVAAARALLVDNTVRLLTLTGPGGVGKTRLAIRLGEDAAAFPDGVVFVSLAAIADPDLVLPTIARDLGLLEVGVLSAAELVADFLRNRRLLLVLDNFEQVRPAATEIAALLATCPNVTALVTSRTPLRIAGERLFPVAPLALPAPGTNDGRGDDPEPSIATIAASAAVQLFVARAQAVALRFILDAGNARAVAAICHRLDGLPLAIELAAARLRLLSPSELLARLDFTLPLLTSGPEDAPDRLRTMRQAIAWSYELLPPVEQTLFRRLAIFVGGFTLEAAERVTGDGCRVSDTGPAVPDSDTCHPSPVTLDRISSLIDASLLLRTEKDGETRLAMLETIREFGLERLEECDETAQTAARHAAWCISLADRGRRIGFLSQGRGLRQLDAEHPNLRAALGWLLASGETAAAVHLAGQLAGFWARRAHWAEGETWLGRALAADDGGPTAARANALVGLSMMLWARDEFAQAYDLNIEAEMVARGAGDAGALAYARIHQGFVALFRGDLGLALVRGEEAVATCAAIPQGFSCNGALWLLARTALERGEDERAQELYARLLESARAGDELSLANCLLGQAVLAERGGDPTRALAGFAEAATVSRGFGDGWFAAQCLERVAETAATLGWPEPAARLLAAAETVRAACGATRTLGLVVGGQGQEYVLAKIRAMLGEGRFATQWAAGAVLTLDEALAEAAALAQPSAIAAPGVPVAPAGLTAREHDVLRLLAGGMTDKEIAIALGIGRRTVSSHVEAIRAKLEAPSRTAAVAIAMRDRLV